MAMLKNRKVRLRTASRMRIIESVQVWFTTPLFSLHQRRFSRQTSGQFAQKRREWDLSYSHNDLTSVSAQVAGTGRELQSVIRAGGGPSIPERRLRARAK